MMAVGMPERHLVRTNSDGAFFLLHSMLTACLGRRIRCLHVNSLRRYLPDTLPPSSQQFPTENCPRSSSSRAGAVSKHAAHALSLHAHDPWLMYFTVICFLKYSLHSA